MRLRAFGKPGQHRAVLHGAKACQELPTNQADARQTPERKTRITRIEQEADRSWVCAGQNCDRVPLAASRSQTIPRSFESTERGRPAADIVVSPAWPNKQFQ